MHLATCHGLEVVPLVQTFGHMEVSGDQGRGWICGWAELIPWQGSALGRAWALGLVCSSPAPAPRSESLKSPAWAWREKPEADAGSRNPCIQQCCGREIFGGQGRRGVATIHPDVVWDPPFLVLVPEPGSERAKLLLTQPLSEPAVSQKR